MVKALRRARSTTVANIKNNNATANPKTANVEYVLPQLANKLPLYQLIEDCVKGQYAVKLRGDVYLPRPNAADTSNENKARYDAYKQRAIFYGVTKRTRNGLVGQVFLTDPIIKVPSILDPVIKDANGNGVDIVQLAQYTHENTLSLGRAGLFVDFPKTNGVVSRADQLSGRVRPTIVSYHPADIINWRTITRGSEITLSLVVLRESYVKKDDGFEVEYDTQYRVLRLIDSLYEQQIWRLVGGGWQIFDTIFPTDGQGNRLEYIPFTFVGSSNNDASVDEPPLYDLAELNIGHYRNSADYEESVFIVGQPTPVISGLTENWVKEVLKGRVELGSRAAISLPEGGSANLLQADANTLAKEAMEAKEKQMVALGARLVENKQVQRTATEAKADEASDTSVLTTVTNNVSAGFKFALEWCAIFQGIRTIKSDESDESINFVLNTDFDFSGLTSQELTAIIQAWQNEALSFTEMRSHLRRAKIATLDDDKAKKEISIDAMTMNAGEDDDIPPSPPIDDDD